MNPYLAPAFLMILMLTLTTQAATWHVADTGNDAADGSEKAPFATLKHAIEIASKTDAASEIVLHAGVYRGDVTIPAVAQSNPAPLLIRAAQTADGKYQEAVIDGGQKITEAQPVDAARGIYFQPFHLANFEPSMWEAKSRIRYDFVADRRAVEAFPASLAPGRYKVNGDEKEGVFFHTSDGKPPGTHDLGMARDRKGLMIQRPNVTVKGLRFRNFQLYFGVSAISIEAANVTVDSCEVWNCWGGFMVGENIPDATIVNCTARDVATGVKSYGKNTAVENCRFIRIEDSFAVPEYEQDQCGIQFYTSHTQTARRNLCIGFQAGIFIKASGGVLIMENNTVVASARGGDRGVGPNTWRPKSICRGNVVVGFDEPISLGTGLSKECTITGNVVWLASNRKRAEEVVGRIKESSGGDNIVALPQFADATKEDYRLAPASVGAALGSDPQAIGALGVAPRDWVDKTPPAVRCEALPPAQPFGMRAQVYVRKNTWIGGKEPELTQDTMINAEPPVWMSPSGSVELKVTAEDALGKINQIRFRIGKAGWSSPEPFRETLKLELPKDTQSTEIAVQVSDHAGNWSEPATARVMTAVHPPKLVGKPIVTPSDHGAIVAFKTDVPCNATMEWGTAGKFDRIVNDAVEIQFRNDNDMGLETTRHISGPRTDHCLALTSAVKAGETVSYRIKLGGYGAAEPSLVDEGRFTVKGPARTLHVATTGVDNETGGAKDRPFATLQFAMDRALPGDRVLVAPGIYTGSVSVSHGGVEGHPIRLESTEPWGAAIDGKRDADFAFNLSNVGHIEISRFEMRWYNGFCVTMYQVQDVAVKGCKFWGRHFVKGRPGICEGVGAYKSKKVAIDNSVFFTLNSAFRLSECDGYRVTNNTALRCLHRVGQINYSSNGYLRNNSFAFGSSYLLDMVLTEEQVKSLDSDYNNFAVQIRADAADAKTLPPAEVLTREENDFGYGESKGLACLGNHANPSKYVHDVPLPTLTAWRARTGQDKHSIFAHPRYADPQNFDFRLLPNSPNLGAGEKGSHIGALGMAK